MRILNLPTTFIDLYPEELKVLAEIVQPQSTHTEYMQSIHVLVESVAMSFDNAAATHARLHCVKDKA